MQIIKKNIFSSLTLLCAVLFSFKATGNTFSTDSLKNSSSNISLFPHQVLRGKTGQPYFKKYAHPLLSPFSYRLGLGITAYAGDLSKAPDFANQKNHLTPYISAGLVYRLTHFVSFRLEATGFQLYSLPEDNSGTHKGFNSYNAEAYFALVHEFIPKKSIENYSKKASPYIYGGIGGVLFNPKSLEDDSNMLSAEDTTYSNKSLMIPAGLGLKYYLHESISIDLEGGVRFTQTDLLDGNIPTGENTKNDIYFTLGAKVTVQILTKYRYKRHLKRQIKNR